MNRIGSFFTASAVLIVLLFAIPVSSADDKNDGNSRRFGSAEQKPLDRQTVQRIFAEANSYYNEGLQTEEISAQELLFEKALLRYKQLFEQGAIVNSRLFCNIGTIYALLGDKGRAVLWYKRGLYYGPRDYRCKNNLVYLRNHLETTDNGMVRAVFLTPKTTFTLFTVFFTLFSAGIALLLHVKRIKAGAVQTALTYTVFLAGVAALIILAAGFASRFSPPQAVIVEEVTLRSGDGVFFSPIEDRPLTPGTEIAVTEERSGWYRITMHNRPHGWVPSDSAEVVPIRTRFREKE